MAATSAPLAAASGTAGAALPAGVAASLATATELAALPDGGWLALDKNGLRLLDASGAERTRHAVRGKQLDTRSQAGGVLATLVDSNTERTVAIDADLKAGTLRVQAPFPAPSFAPEAACLYRDAQQLSYQFLIAKDGQGEQWLLDGAERKLVRKLALPAHVRHCRVDDATGTLFVSESGMGLWAYSADAEGAGERHALALRQPFGKLAGGAGALALLPGGVAMLDAKGKSLNLFSRRNGAWLAQAPRALKATANSRTLASRSTASGAELLLNDDETKQWRTMTAGPHAGTAATASANTAAATPAGAPAIVLPRAQTEPMARLGDAADDPAIWVHPSDPSASRVLGTNKKQGLLVYDMQGRQTQLLESGRLNNVDVRQNVLLDGSRHDLALATQRDDNTMVLFTIDGNGAVAETVRFPTGLEKIYGICVYQPAGGGLEAFVNDKDGTFQHYRIGRKDGAFTSTLLRSFKVATQPEGCVADDRTGRLFVGEEKRGVWTLPAAADKGSAMSMVLPVGAVLTADVEGMSLYHGAQSSYLVVSSQGSNSYVVLDAAAPYKVRGSFRIGLNVAAGIDGASETDGLDVSSANLGGAYGEGMLVVQDGYKRLPDGPQNFKYVAWSDIATALKLR
ncbi:3-phytase [Massilia sp. Root418]|nr:3-phytase [Massilia sp. Root418]